MTEGLTSSAGLTSPVTSSQPARRNRVEYLIFPSLVLLQVLLIMDPIPWTHSFWLDEIHTQLLVEDPDLSHAARALANGVDFNPPTYYLLARLVTMTGVAPEIGLRAFSLACVILCGLSIYTLLRDHCSRTTATACVLLIWSFTVVQTQAFEARFYAPWMAAASLVALSLQRTMQSRSLGWRVVLALAGIVTCTAHYFGVISVGLIAAAFLLRQWFSAAASPERKSIRQRVEPLMWLTPGFAALVACIACFYRGQRSALSVTTWVPPMDWKTLQSFLWDLIPVWSIAVAVAAWGLTRILSGLRQHDATAEMKAAIVPEVRAEIPVAAGLAMMPVCLMLFSWLLQPALISRYGSVGILGFAVLMGSLLRQAPNWVSAAFCVWFMAAGMQSLSRQSDYWRRMETRQTEMIARLRQLDADIPVLFESRHAMYPIVRYAPDLAPRIRFLALSDENLRQYQSATPFRIVERDVAQRIESFYPDYQTIPFDELGQLPRSFLVAFRNRKDFGSQLENFVVTPVRPQIYELHPKESGLTPVISSVTGDTPGEHHAMLTTE